MTAFGKNGHRIRKRLEKLSRKTSKSVIEHTQENIVERISHIRQIRLLILEWSLLVIAVICLSIAQSYWYTDSYATEDYKQGGTYTEATLGEVNSLNPLFASTSSERTIAKLLFSSLSSSDSSGHTGYGLADSITSDKTGKTWSVTLRKDLKWSDGTPLTNEDVLFTTNIITNSKLTNNYSSNLSNIKISEQDGKIVFDLPSANAFFDTSLDFPILPKHILQDVSIESLLEHSFSSKPISSGAFSYNATQTISSSGEKIVYLVANNYYYKGRPLLDSFVVHAFTKSEDIITALNNGTVTASGDLSVEEGKKITATSLNKRQTVLNYGVYIFFNTSRVQDRDFRRAIKQGLNFQQFREKLDGEQLLEYPFTTNQIELEKYPEDIKYNPEEAKKVIANYLSAGAFGEGINIVTIKSGQLSKITATLSEQLQELGLKNNVTVYEPGQDFASNILAMRDYDVLVYEIGLGSDPDVSAYYHKSGATTNGHNLSNYNNPIASDLILSARATTDPILRAKKYQNFLNYFVADTPAIGLYQTNYNYYVNKKAKTYSQENRLVTASDRLIDVEKWGINIKIKNRTP